MNSINYRNKNDFNNSLIEKRKKEASKNSEEGEEGEHKQKDEEKEELENLLQVLFPNYQQHYWNDRSTWNPIQNPTSRTINESEDISLHSIDLQQC